MTFIINTHKVQLKQTQQNRGNPVNKILKLIVKLIVKGQWGFLLHTMIWLTDKAESGNYNWA